MPPSPFQSSNAPASPAVAPSSSGGHDAGQQTPRDWGRVSGRSEAVRLLEGVIARVGSFDCPVLVTGETGCGKEEVARAIHAAGPRADRPFLAVNCGGIVSTLAESQLFGHARGAFTGADKAATGAFRAADQGVLFLDEIGELPLDLQPKLLRALQQREVTPVGTTHQVPFDVQVIAATNRDLVVEVAAGRFRKDLFYRLNTIHLALPPLRARSEDIPLFIEHFSRYFAGVYRMPQWHPDAATLERFVRFDWPGNVRQLAQTIEKIYILDDRQTVVLEEIVALPGAVAHQRPGPDVPPLSPSPEVGGDGGPAGQPAGAGDAVLPMLNLDELQRLAVRQALAATEGHRGRAARLLGVCPNTMTKLVAASCPEATSPRGGRRRGGVRKPR